MRVHLTINVPNEAAARAAALPAEYLASTNVPPCDDLTATHLSGDRIERSGDPLVSEVSAASAFATALHRLSAATGLMPLTLGSGSLHYVRHGSLRVPRFADADFTQAVRYLNRDSVMRGIVAKVEHSHTQYTLKIIHDNNDRFVPWTHTIEWDPHSALRTTRGGRQSPALGLGHELDHAVEPQRLRDAGEVRRLPHYDNAEERRVIRGSETHAAHTLGEAARTNHRGTCYRVDSPVVC